MKEWECVEVKDHKNIGAVIKGRQNDGWCLHTYQAIERHKVIPLITCCLKKASRPKQATS